MYRLLKAVFLVLSVLFVLPAAIHAGLWLYKDRPTSWRTANWSSSGLLKPPPVNASEVMVLAARTGGLKGALATHSWILLKPKNQGWYDRYEVVGWGRPVRKNAYAPDARWYSNNPEVLYRVNGKKAARLIPDILRAIENYPKSRRGDYRIWPGPNSNTFVASIIRDVQNFDAVLDASAVGRDYPVNGLWYSSNKNETTASLGGYAGFRFGGSSGLELNLFGLVAGFGPALESIKLPGFGTIPISRGAIAGTQPK